MAATRGFHHLAMNVQRYDRAMEFYTQVLGMKVWRAWGGDGSRAAMIDAGNSNYIEIFESGEEGAPEGRVMHFALRVDDCDAVLERVRAAGLEITTEPKDVDIQSDPVYPVRIAFFRGPAGEIVELMQDR